MRTAICRSRYILMTDIAFNQARHRVYLHTGTPGIYRLKAEASAFKCAPKVRRAKARRGIGTTGRKGAYACRLGSGLLGFGYELEPLFPLLRGHQFPGDDQSHEVAGHSGFPSAFKAARNGIWRRPCEGGESFLIQSSRICAPAPWRCWWLAHGRSMAKEEKRRNVIFPCTYKQRHVYYSYVGDALKERRS